MPGVESDLIAAAIRSQLNQLKELTQALEAKSLSKEEVLQRLRTVVGQLRTIRES